MNPRISEQLDKILALADSSHEGEAIVAVRKARQMLSRDGLSFADLARVASARQGYGQSSGLFSRRSRQPDPTETQLHHLQQQLEDLRAQIQTQDLQVGFWRRRALDLEQNSLRAQNEAERWKKLASETAERLWDMGKDIGSEGFAAGKAMPE